MTKNRGMIGLLTAVLLFALTLLAVAHPVLHGGIRWDVAEIQGQGAIRLEYVPDRKAGEVRLYIVEETVEQAAGRKEDKVRNLAVREETVGKEKMLLMPLPDPGAGKSWLQVAPVKAAGGFLFYKFEVTLRVVLDGGGTPVELKFAPGKDGRGDCCLAAPLKMAKAQTIRVEDATLTIHDLKGASTLVIKMFTKGSASWAGDNGTDHPLSKYEESIAKAPNADKFRRPQAPPVPKSR